MFLCFKGEVGIRRKTLNKCDKYQVDEIEFLGHV